MSSLSSFSFSPCAVLSLRFMQNITASTLLRLCCLHMTRWDWGFQLCVEAGSETGVTLTYGEVGTGGAAEISLIVINKTPLLSIKSKLCSERIIYQCLIGNCTVFYRRMMFVVLMLIQKCSSSMSRFQWDLGYKSIFQLYERLQYLRVI